MAEHDAPAVMPSASARFRPVRLVVVAFAALALLAATGDWHGAQIALPRFCSQDDAALQRLAVVIAAGDEPNQMAPALGATDGVTRRERMVAAKLAYLIPREPDEPADIYMQRIQHELHDRCQWSKS